MIKGSAYMFDAGVMSHLTCHILQSFPPSPKETLVNQTILRKYDVNASLD